MNTSFGCQASTGNDECVRLSAADDDGKLLGTHRSAAQRCSRIEEIMTEIDLSSESTALRHRASDDARKLKGIRLT